jgi:hypothetical protein
MLSVIFSHIKTTPCAAQHLLIHEVMTGQCWPTRQRRQFIIQMFVEHCLLSEYHIHSHYLYIFLPNGNVWKLGCVKYADTFQHIILKLRKLLKHTKKCWNMRQKKLYERKTNIPDYTMSLLQLSISEFFYLSLMSSSH